MRFFAVVVPGSMLDRAHRRQNHVSFELDGVAFRARAPGPKGTDFACPIYFSEELSADQVNAMLAHSNVRLEAIGATTPEEAAAPVDAVPEAESDEPRRRGKR